MDALVIPLITHPTYLPIPLTAGLRSAPQPNRIQGWNVEAYQALGEAFRLLACGSCISYPHTFSIHYFLRKRYASMAAYSYHHQSSYRSTPATSL